MLFLDFWLTPIAKSSWVYISLWQRFRWYAQWGRINFSIFSNKRKNVTVCNGMLQNPWVLTLQRFNERSEIVRRRYCNLLKRSSSKHINYLNERIRIDWKWDVVGFLQVLGSKIYEIWRLKSFENLRTLAWARAPNGITKSKIR